MRRNGVGTPAPTLICHCFHRPSPCWGWGLGGIIKHVLEIGEHFLHQPFDVGRLVLTVGQTHGSFIPILQICTQHLFLSIYYVPGLALGAGGTTVNQTDKTTCSYAADILMRK